MYYDCVSRFREEKPELHKDSKFKMPGGKYMAYAILAFFAFIFIVLLINSTTRFAVLFAPVWAIVLVIMYQKYRKESEKATIAMEDEKDLERELKDK